MKLFIKEHVYFEPEYEDNGVAHTYVENYCDEKTNILVHHMIIDEELEVGKLYDFETEDEETEESWTNFFRVLKKMENNNYILCRCGYYGDAYAVRSKNLLPKDMWVICDVEQQLAINLNDYTN